MAFENAINVVDWTTRLSYSADSQEIGWQKSVILGIRGRSNAFNGLIGGLSGMKPITEVMDFRALQGQEIVVTLARPLGGPGTQGPPSLTRVVGREENPKHSTFRAKVGLFAHMVAGEQIVITETVIGRDWDNRQRKTLTEYFAWKQGDDIQFEMKVKAHARNTVYPNNRIAIDDLGTNDYLNLGTTTTVQEILNANQAQPFDITRSQNDEEILNYLLMGPHKAWSGIQGSNAYQNLLSNADQRGKDNKLFKGGLPDYFGTRLYKWNVEDGVQDGPLGAPCSPIAYTSFDIPANTTTTAQVIYGGGTTNTAYYNTNTSPLYFQYYEAAQYLGHEGEKQAATTGTTQYLGIKIITGSDAGKIAFFAYQVNNGNTITALYRLGASITGYINTTVGSMTYAAMLAAGANGYKGLSIGIIPAGSVVYQVNARGVPYCRSFGLGRNAILAGWGSLAPNTAPGSGGGSPGQRLFETQDAGRLFSVGWQQVWGCTAVKDANAMVNGYVLVVSAYSPPGWPDIAGA